MFGALVQASAICHVVTCSLPSDPPACHHEAPETPSPDTCKEFAAAAASVSLDITLTPVQEIAPEVRETAGEFERAEFQAHSPPPTFTILRI